SSSSILKVLACCLHASIPTAQEAIIRLGSAGGADNEVNSRIEPGNPRNCLAEESRASTFLFAPGTSRSVADSDRGPKFRVESSPRGGHNGPDWPSHGC